LGDHEEMSENQTGKKYRKTSSIWLHFNNIVDCKAECRIFKIKISVRETSTTNL